MSVKSYFNKARETWAAWRHSRRTNSILLYLTCLVISFFFWLFLTLNSETQKDLSLPFNLTSIPDSTTIISGLPDVVKVNVRDKGSSLLRYDFGNEPTLSIDFLEHYDGSGSLKISSIEMLAKVRKLFANSTAIVAIAPDSLSVKYTNQPGKKVPIKLDIDVTADFRCIINGETMLSADSAIVYSDQNTLDGIVAVSSRRITAEGLTDTLTRTIDLVPVAGAKIVPNRVTVKVPIEPLISKRQNVNIEVVNVSAGMNVITFPSSIEASFLVPQSMYRKMVRIRAIANYNDILYSDGNNKIAVKIVEVPSECREISLASDSVEYIVEKVLVQ